MASTQKYAVYLNTSLGKVLDVALSYEDAKRLASERRHTHRFWSEAYAGPISDDEYALHA